MSGSRAIKPDKDHPFKLRTNRGTFIRLVPGGPRRAYLWIGDAEDNYVATVSGRAALSKLAHAILRELGEEGA